MAESKQPRKRRDSVRGMRGAEGSNAASPYSREAYGSRRSASEDREQRAARAAARRERSAQGAGFGSGAASGSAGGGSHDAASMDAELAKYSRHRAGSSSDNPYSRKYAKDTYAAESHKRTKRRRVIKIAVIAVLALILGLGGAACAYMYKIQGNMQQGIDRELLAVLDPTVGGEPFYMLLMGVDGSYERGADEQNDNAGTRSDSMILARIDPEAKQVTMISLARDTMVNMGRHGTQKLNAAHAFGGPAYAVQVVEDMAGVSISHYAEINFDAFKAMVDELGGITVDVPVEIDDPNVEAYVPAGVQELNGAQALSLCRSRHSYDDYGGGDYFRAANQRLVLGAIMEEVLSADPITLARTVEAMSEYVLTDMSVSEILGLAMQMAGMDMDSSFYTAMAPTTSAYINGVWWEQLNQKQWDAMMERVDQGLPPYEEDVVHEQTGTVLATSGNGGEDGSSESDSGEPVQRSGTVTVKNGNGKAGVGDEAVSRVTPLGYTATASNANNFNYQKTVVVYADSKQKEAAEEIVDALGVGTAVKNDGSYLYEGDFLVLIGADWK